MRDTNIKPYYFQRKVRSLKRKILWHLLQKKLNIILVSEFPKSGGTWFAKMLAEILNLNFPRNNTKIKFESSVIHGHVKYKKYFHKPICVVRDGRDVIISAYFHFLFENEWNIPEFVENNRKKLNFKDYNDVENNLTEFIKYLYFDYGSRIGHMSWSDFINQWYDKDVLIVKYEDLLSKPEETIINAIRYLEKEIDHEKITSVIENNSLKNIKKNTDKSYSKSFVRKGIAGDWKNYFNEESKNLFKNIAGEELIKLGYEKDLNW